MFDGDSNILSKKKKKVIKNQVRAIKYFSETKGMVLVQTVMNIQNKLMRMAITKGVFKRRTLNSPLIIS